MEACNRHYITTTGQSLTQLLKAKSSVYTFLPGVRGGVAPYVLSAVRRSKECDELLHGLNSLSINSNSRRKVKSVIFGFTYFLLTLCSIPAWCLSALMWFTRYALHSELQAFSKMQPLVLQMLYFELRHGPEPYHLPYRS